MEKMGTLSDMKKWGRSPILQEIGERPHFTILSFGIYRLDHRLDVAIAKGKCLQP